jgi:adenylate cyclase class 2
MSFEVELKYRVADLGPITRELELLGARVEPAVAMEDVYFGHPCRDFKARDEAFRIRRIGEENRITYKGPKQGGPTKTREELELSFEGGREGYRKLATLLERLGFVAVAAIPKLRRAAHVSVGKPPIALEVALDEVAQLGLYVEVEAWVESAAELPIAQAAVTEFAGRLGLTEVEPRSYLRMMLELREGEGQTG